MTRVKYATATYTGGGIYQYSGELDNGNYFLCFTDWEDCMIEVNENPDAEENAEECGYEEWQNEHLVAELSPLESYETLVSAMEWILKNKPIGNYAGGDIERNLEKLKEKM